MTRSSDGIVGLKVPGSGMLLAIVISFCLSGAPGEPLYKRMINHKNGKNESL
jgi:hypothetical protein